MRCRAVLGDARGRGGSRHSGRFRPSGWRLEPGHLADLQIYDYTPPTPLTADNFAWHWMFAFTNQLVKHVMVGGKWVLRDRSMVNVKGAMPARRGREQAAALGGGWRRCRCESA